MLNKLREDIAAARPYLVYAACRYLSATKDEAEELAQSAILSGLEKMSWQPGQATVKTWLYTIMRNKCINRSRSAEAKAKKGPMPTILPIDVFENGIENHVVDPCALPDEALLNKLRVGRLQDALSNLPDKVEKSFRLKYYDNMPYSKISAVLGVPKGTVKTFIKRGLQQLRKDMGAGDSYSAPGLVCRGRGWSRNWDSILAESLTERGWG